MIYLSKLVKQLGYAVSYDEEHLTKCVYSHCRADCQILSVSFGTFFIVEDTIAIRNYLHSYFYLQYGINNLSVLVGLAENSAKTLD